ncbi:MAG: hypothetical protein IH931_07220 [candidate division Zixibacteria bacterium]|nr:hypothetical protein [candidate division Zixibacteria bacterium]
MFGTTKSAMVLFILLAIIVAIPSAASARENSLKKGKWALQFEIDRDFDLSGFQGNTLSIKKHTADNRAYRLGFTFFLDIGDSETLRILNDTILLPRERDFNSRRFNFSFQKIYYASTDASVNMFYGIGTAYSFQHSNNESVSYNRSRTQIQFSNSTNDSWSAGITGVFGAEWFFAENMSLLGEYNTVANYRQSKRENLTRIVEGNTILNSSFSEDKTDSFRLSSSRVKFGLSVYF